MARFWQAPQLLLAIFMALVAHTYQVRKKTFLSVGEVSASDPYVTTTMQYLSDDFNKKSNDKYNFRIVRLLKVQKQITDHMEFHVNMEMRRTTCQKLETTNCSFQEGELYKQIECFYSVFVVPWFEKYKILNKNCTDD
ncbi:cystatin-11 [Lycaon pictus]|nr:cystatin-11 isoform X1 [Canis lupus dingo]XP_038427279.1 cystatin-11 isoform X1 [Canis lupus familiaris]XP_041588233.1 cystatin-11 [Vulpes lagopus]XP_848363.3 cystatin-11 isoform X1 [Canis lupus familiaris]